MIHGRAGNDTLIGGAGDDTFVIRFTDAGTTTITDTDGALWHGTFRPASFPASWTPAPAATSGFGIGGNATFVSAGVWDLAVTDHTGVVQHLTLAWTGGDLTITHGSAADRGHQGLRQRHIRHHAGERRRRPGLALSANAVAENSANGTVIGTLSATDPEGAAADLYARPTTRAASSRC